MLHFNPTHADVMLCYISAPPTLTSYSPSLLIHKEGASAEMFCTATGIPTPGVTWLKDDKELTNHGRLTVSDNKVHIKNLDKSDAGVYSCLFKNTVAQVSHTIRLVIESKLPDFILILKLLILKMGSKDSVDNY